jgi:hypothetical protein
MHALGASSAGLLLGKVGQSCHSRCFAASHGQPAQAGPHGSVRQLLVHTLSSWQHRSPALQKRQVQAVANSTCCVMTCVQFTGTPYTTTVVCCATMCWCTLPCHLQASAMILHPIASAVWWILAAVAALLSIGDILVATPWARGSTGPLWPSSGTKRAGHAPGDVRHGADGHTVVPDYPPSSTQTGKVSVGGQPMSALASGPVLLTHHHNQQGSHSDHRGQSLSAAAGAEEFHNDRSSALAPMDVELAALPAAGDSGSDGVRGETGSHFSALQNEMSDQQGNGLLPASYGADSAGSHSRLHPTSASHHTSHPSRNQTQSKGGSSTTSLQGTALQAAHRAATLLSHMSLVRGHSLTLVLSVAAVLFVAAAAVLQIVCAVAVHGSPVGTVTGGDAEAEFGGAEVPPGVAWAARPQGAGSAPELGGYLYAGALCIRWRHDAGSGGLVVGVGVWIVLHVFRGFHSGH